MDQCYPRLFFINTLSEVSETNNNYVWGMPSYVCWIIIGVLLVFSGIFSASENAFSTCNKYHFRAEAEKGKKTAKIITYLVDHFDNTLITVLVSSNTVATVMSYLSAMLWYQICHNNGWGSGIEAVLSTVVMGILFYIISDTIPKVISKAIPNQLAMVLCYPIIVLQFLLYPIIFLFRMLLKAIHKMFHLKDENLLSKEDIMRQVDDAVNQEDTIIEDSEEEEKPEKLFENDEKDLLNHVFTFDERKVSAVYTKLDKVFSLNIEGLTSAKINEELKKCPYSRIPIYDGSRDNVIGILVLKIYFKEYVEDPHLSIPSILEKVISVSPDEVLDDAFEKLNSNKVHMGIVKDKNGKVLGIITMEDILEELIDDNDEENKVIEKKGKRA